MGIDSKDLSKISFELDHSNFSTPKIVKDSSKTQAD